MSNKNILINENLDFSKWELVTGMDVERGYKLLSSKSTKEITQKLIKVNNEIDGIFKAENLRTDYRRINSIYISRIEVYDGIKFALDLIECDYVYVDCVTEYEEVEYYDIGWYTRSERWVDDSCCTQVIVPLDVFNNL